MGSPTPSSPEVQAYEQRLRRLERSNGRLKLILVLALIPTAVAFTRAPQQSVADKLAAHQFVLIDDDGNECGMWRAEKIDGQKIGGGSLAFIGDDGLRLLLSTGNGSPVLMMNGGGRLQQDSRLGHASIGVSAEKGPHVSLWGQNTDKQGDALWDRSTELRTCWGDNTHAVITKCGEAAPWTAP